MNIRFFRPDPRLQPFIERYWSWEHEGSTPLYLPRVPPGVSADLYFHYRKPFEINDTITLEQSHLIYTKMKSVQLSPAACFGFIAVRFRCGMFGHFSSIPLQLFDGQFPGSGTIWGRAGNRVEEQIASAFDPVERVAILDDFLLQRLKLNYRPANGWDAVARKLYYHHDDAKLSHLSRQMNVTPRHFRRMFEEVNGTTPKHYQQLSRFHSVLKQLLLTQNTDYLPVALESGYFDQTHFIKEFKRFMDMTPAKFLNLNNFNSHFYYKSGKP